MNTRQRFHETMQYGTPDRVLYFEEGIREEALAAWREQGMPPGADLSQMIATDRREEINPELYALPELKTWPCQRGDLDEFRRCLDPDDSSRLPEDWKERFGAWEKDDQVRMLRVSDGFFEFMGVEDADTFVPLMKLLVWDPEYVREAMAIQGEFCAQITEKVLSEVEIDAAVFSEPIGANHGSLISPKMYEDFALRSYEPILEVLARHGVKTIIWRTYANARILIPSILKWGINCLWAVEVETGAMDYGALRKEFGRDLRLIGGIDLDTLYLGKEAIRREVMEKVPPLVAEGGYAPLADGRVREGVAYENYIYYRKLLEEVTGG